MCIIDHYPIPTRKSKKELNTSEKLERDRGTEGQRDRGTEGQRDRGTLFHVWGIIF